MITARKTGWFRFWKTSQYVILQEPGLMRSYQILVITDLIKGCKQIHYLIPHILRSPKILPVQLIIRRSSISGKIHPATMKTYFQTPNLPVFKVKENILSLKAGGPKPGLKIPVQEVR